MLYIQFVDGVKHDVRLLYSRQLLCETKSGKKRITKKIQFWKALLFIYLLPVNQK